MQCLVRTIVKSIDLIVTRPFIIHLSLYTRLKPTCDKKTGIMGLLYIFNQWGFNSQVRGPRFKPRCSLDLKFFSFFNSTKRMIEILTKIRAKITIIVVKNKEPHYFIIIYKCKEVPLSLFSYQMWLQLLTPMSGLVTIRSMVKSYNWRSDNQRSSILSFGI